MLECLLPPPSPKYCTQIFDILIIIKMNRNHCQSIPRHREMMRICNAGLVQCEAPRNLRLRLESLYTLITTWGTQELCRSCTEMMQGYNELRWLTSSINKVVQDIRSHPQRLQPGFMELQRVKSSGEFMEREVYLCLDRLQFPQPISNRLAQGPIVTQSQIAQIAQIAQQVPQYVDPTNLQPTIPNPVAQQPIATQVTTQQVPQYIDLTESSEMLPHGNP